MIYDLFYELAVPDARLESEAQVYRRSVDELVLADALGFGCAWLVEHHFMPHYSHCSAPELVLANLAARTQRLGLGFAIKPLPYHHPVQLAEQVATLDILSHGRVQFGFGRGFSPLEFETFGQNMAQSRQISSEALDVVRLAWSKQRLTYKGKHFQFSELEVLPKPVQQPHPPIWMAGVSPDSFSLAAQLGVNAMAGPFKPWFMVKEDLKTYRRAINAQSRQGKLAMTVGIFCHENPRQARALAKPAFEWFYHHLLQTTRPVLKHLYPSYEHQKQLGNFTLLFERMIKLGVLEKLGMVVVGTPQHCVEQLQKYQAAGVDHLLLAPGAGAMPTQQVQECLHLLARELLQPVSA